jgi:hypothetical protein
VRIAVPALIIVGLIARPIAATTQKTDQVVASMLNEFEKAFTEKRLERLTLPKGAQVRLTIEKSLSGESIKKRFGSFASLETWLQGREIDGLPSRAIKTRDLVSRFKVTYDNQGISHSTLYVNAVHFGYKDGHPYVRAIELCDGQ